jgi:hypothetical protein
MQSAERAHHPAIAGVESPQRPVAAAELISRGARFAECVQYFGILWQLPSRRGNWSVGDAYSGQFRLASAVFPLALATRDRLRIATAFEFGDVRIALLSDQRILAGTGGISRFRSPDRDSIR